MASENHPEATKALSVYNALSRARRDMTRQEVLTFLRSTWTPALDETYVESGASYLVSAGFASEPDGVLTPPSRDMNGAPPRLGRGPDGITLAWI